MSHTWFSHFDFCCSPSEIFLCEIVHSNNSTSMVLPPLLYPPYQSRTPLPRVIEPSPPSPTSTEGPDATDSDSSVYTASSSSSSFSFSSSSSFYATSSSSSSDQVSQLDTLNRVGGACLSENLLAFSFSFITAHAYNLPCLFLLFRSCCQWQYIMPLLVLLVFQWFPPQKEMLLKDLLFKQASPTSHVDGLQWRVQSRSMKAICSFVIFLLQIWFPLPFRETVTGFCSSGGQTWKNKHFNLFLDSAYFIHLARKNEFPIKYHVYLM